MNEIINWLTFDHTVGLATIFGLGLIIYQILISKKEEKTTRTIDLIGRYYKDYHDLKIAVKDKYKTENGQPILLFDNQQEIDECAKNYQKQLGFIYELAMYWRKDLIDKDIIREQIGNKIAFECFILDQIYKNFPFESSQLNALREMRDEIVTINPLNFRLKKLYKIMNILKNPR